MEHFPDQYSLVTVEGKSRKARETAMCEFWQPKVFIGQRLAHSVSGQGGTVYKVHPWGVEVWVDYRKGERENWSWGQFIRRQPRYFKRFPRTGRFPRLLPSKQCHCKSGELKVVRGGDHAVRCQTCKKLIGNESFSNRFRKASKCLREAALRKRQKIAIPPRKV